MRIGTLIVTALGVLATFVGTRSASAEEQPTLPADAVLATFDRAADLPTTGAGGAAITFDPQGFAGGALRLTPAANPDPKGMSGALTIPLKSGIDALTTAGVRMQIKAISPGGANSARIRLTLRDDAGRAILQRAVVAPADGGWQRVDLPLDQFRFGDLAGGWNQVRSIVLSVESPVTTLWLDDVRLTPAPKDATPAGKKLAAFAFVGRDMRMVEADGPNGRPSTLLVATDAPQLAEADLLRLLGNLKKSRAVVHRVFGDAVRPADLPTPSALLIFKDRAGFTDFWQRQGRQWQARVMVSPSDGYTVQDIATSTWSDAAGKDRPVWLHEGVHALVARDVGLLPGHPAHGWLQEGIANYLQLIAYPKSLPADAYPGMFKRGVIDEENATFRPLRIVMTGPVSTRQYAQVASLVAYLSEKEPAWLPKIARTLADGGTIEQAFTECGTDFDKLQAAWLAWGRDRFAQPRVDAHFEVPAEWK